jgi:hypothetical protein
VSLTCHVILSEDFFLHIRDYKMHNVIGGRHMYLQYPYAYSHLHAAYACAGFGSALAIYKEQVKQ